MESLHVEFREAHLEHHGVKGMHWGQRKTQFPGVSRSTNRQAQKDAHEFARAKLFYGDGAGTRRKLIKNTVEAKAKRDPSYKKAFDHHLENQDLSKHASSARSERRRKDTVGGATKTAKGVHRQLTGGFGSVSVASAVIAAAYIGAKKTGVDQHIKRVATKTIRDLRTNRGDKSSGQSATEFLRSMGMNV